MGAIILSNHEGTDAPMSLEIYNDAPIRMWGAHEMNSGLIKMYKYQTKVYYHEKKHWNLFLARAFCLIASPLTNLFYKGLNLISTYKDARLKKTIRESCDALREGQNIVIYPEDSTNGYLPQLEGFHAGFYLLAETCLKKGLDLPIFTTFFKKEEKIYVVDKPIKYSELKLGKTKEEIINTLLKRTNELGQMTFTEEELKKHKKTIKNILIMIYKKRRLIFFVFLYALVNKKHFAGNYFIVKKTKKENIYEPTQYRHKTTRKLFF